MATPESVGERPLCATTKCDARGRLVQAFVGPTPAANSDGENPNLAWVPRS